MTTSSHVENSTTQSRKRGSPLFIFFLLVFVILLGVGGVGIWTVERQMKENLAAQLKLILSGNVESLKIWTEGTKLDAQVLSRQPEIHEKLVSLLEIAKPKSITTEALRQTPELAWLRKHLGEACKTYGYVGFVLFDLTGLQVAALLDEPIGTRQLLGKSDFFYRSRQGDTTISQPFSGEVDLPDENGIFHSNRATMFVSTPIYNHSGEGIGVLAFRLRPEKEFTHILSLSRFGETGETYAFNDEGIMVSNSRFDPQLVELGLILPGQKSIFNIQVRDPGRNLAIKKLHSEEKASQWPLTFMADQAIQQVDGVQVEGYNDYRGIPIVGAWTWITDLDIGLTTELDVAEAFRPMKTLLVWFLFLFGLLIVFGIIAFFLRSRYTRSQQQIIENEQRLSSFLDCALDSIICIDIFGTIHTVNTAVKTQFGYDSSELLGKNIKVLMPEPYHSEHDGYLQAYLKTGKRHIINMAREVTAQRKNGTTFPMELSVSESIVNGQQSFLGIIRDISERKEVEEETRKSQKAIESIHRERNLILNSAGEGIYGLDNEGVTTFVNPAACKMLGYSKDELMGKGQHALIHHSYPDEAPYSRDKCHIYAAFKDGKVHKESEEVFWRKNGSSFPVEYISQPIYDNGIIKGAVVTFTDITARKVAEKELQSAYSELENRIIERTLELNTAKEEAEQHNRAKSEFLSRMSHELRTPMNAILGFTQLMEESTRDPLPKAHRKRTSQILKAGNHLLELINEVLDLASIESGKITVSLEPICIADLAEEVLTVVRPMSQKFNITLINEIIRNKNIYVLADKTRLKQILLNLLSNGIKYNRQEGSVTLSAFIEKNSQLRINIIDTGMGIPEEKFNQLFAPFNRLGAENSEIEGTGIGMTISKKLIELMDGSIGVESTLGAGSTFYISLPVCQLQQGAGESEKLSDAGKNKESEEDIRPFTLLYIEDNPANLKLVEDILEDFIEINLLSSPDAELGLDIALYQKPDLILMDINLPGMDGIEALKRLKNFEETHDIPVIAMSANAMKKDIDRTLAEGFKAYITKPIDIGNFRKTIEEELRLAAITKF
jgi:PAS domain S-box-containing protein